MRKKSLLAVLLALTAVTLITSVSFSEVKPYNGEKVHLTVAVFPSLDIAYNALLPEFSKAYPNITVEVKSLGYGDHHNNLITVIAAGKGAPDVAAIEIGYIAQLGAGGGFENLLKLPYNAVQYKKDFTPYKWAQASTGPNELIALPVDIAPGCAFIYQPTWASKKVDINSIKTMDDLFAAGKKLTFDSKGDGVIDHWLLSHAQYIFNMIFYSDSQRYFDKEGKPALNTPRIKTAFTWAKKFRDAGLDAKISDWSNEWFAMFQKGTAAYVPSGAWLAGHLKTWIATNQSGNYRVALLPSINKGEKRMMLNQGGSFLAIPSQIPDVNKAAAWEFIKFACTRVNSQIISFEKADAFPAWMPAWKDEGFSEGVEYLGGQKARMIWIDIAKAIPEVYVNPKDSLAQNILQTALFDVLDGKKGIDAALAEAQKELETKMEQ